MVVAQFQIGALVEPGAQLGAGELALDARGHFAELGGVGAVKCDAARICVHGKSRENQLHKRDVGQVHDVGLLARGEKE